MSKNERMSKVEIPAWWLAKAMPLLNSPTVKLADVARAASAHAGRSNPWDQSAISKFKDGVGRTVALTNGISEALRIPPPFFTAPTEQAASEMYVILQRERERTLSIADGVADAAFRDGLVDAGRARGAHSFDGAKRGPGERSRRARSGRP